MLGYFYIINHVEKVTDRLCLVNCGFCCTNEEIIYTGGPWLLYPPTDTKKKDTKRKKKKRKPPMYTTILDLDLEVYYRGLFCIHFWRDLVKALCSYLESYCTHKSAANYQKWQQDQCEAWAWVAAPPMDNFSLAANVFHRMRGMQPEEDKPLCQGGIWQVWDCFILKKTCFVESVSCSWNTEKISRLHFY